EPEEVFVDPSAKAYIDDLASEGVPVERANNDITTGIQTVASFVGPGFTVDPDCVHTIAEFESYQYPEEGKRDNDKPLKQNDHCMDALRYALMGYFRGGDVENESA